MRSPLSYLLVALGGPLGYIAGCILTHEPEAVAQHAPNSAAALSSTGAPGPAMITGALEGSSMVVEWDRLNAEGGGDFAKLFARIKDTEDAFRRRAYRAAALSDWVARDPKNTLIFLRGKDKWMATQFVREWLRTNPNAAIDQLLSDGAASRGELGSLLEDIAKLAPGRLAEICAKNITPDVVPGSPQKNSLWSALNPERAFAVFAGQDLEAARAAAETLSGSMRDRALAGIGGAWAEKDGVAALAWAEQLPPGAGRDAVLQRVLASWAKTDPFAALGKLDLLTKAKNNNNGGSQSNGVSQVLAEASKRDWYATMEWLKAHPERSGNNVTQGLHDAFSRRLRDDPIPMMRDLVAGTMPALSDVFGSAISGEGYAQRDAIWGWLQGQPNSPTTDKLRRSVLAAVAYKEPAAAMDLVRNLPASEESLEIFNQVVDNMFQSGNGVSAAKLDEWYEKAPPGMRPFLLQNGLDNSGEEIGANAAKWIARLGEVPADMREEMVSGLAAGWASNDPGAAAKWALSLPNPEEQAQAFRSVAGIWARTDNEEFAQMLEKMPAGAARDQGTQALSQSLVQSYPEAAWDWAAEIQDENLRLQALRNIYSSYSGRNRTAADELLHSGNFSDAQIKQFEQVRGQRGSRYETPY